MSRPEPNWRPIIFLPEVAEMIDGMLEAAEDVYGSLQEAKAKPHVMDDYTIARVQDVHGTQLEDLWLYEKQLSFWRKTNPPEDDVRELNRLTEQLDTLRGLLTNCLALADTLKDSTIDKILAKDEFDLGLEELLRKRPPE